MKNTYKVVDGFNGYEYKPVHKSEASAEKARKRIASQCEKVGIECRCEVVEEKAEWSWDFEVSAFRWQVR